MEIAKQSGTITTFYSYKGGTGRTMALANVAWILAANGRRVLTIDWDLEAPGLHRYLAPFLPDPECKQTEGLLDWIYEYLVALTESPGADKSHDWAEPYAALDGYASAIKWQFPDNGCLHLINAGQQNPGYAERVNKLDWFKLYTEHGGKAFIESAFAQARQRYDHILIDSRTGVADTSGICTIQLPDRLVALYTLNNQSIEGCSEVARHARAARETSGRPLSVLPVATRVELAEADRLRTRQALARTRCEQFVPERERRKYFAEMQLPYVPYYAYEEVLASVRERADSGHPLLAGFLHLASKIAESGLDSLPEISPAKRDAALARYAAIDSAATTAESQGNSEELKEQRTVVAAPVQVHWDIFISHQREHDQQAEALYRHLSARATVFMASLSVPLGSNREEAIKLAQQNATMHVFLVGSRAPIKNGWYAVEMVNATDRAKASGAPRIVPVLVDGAKLDRAGYGPLLEYHAVNLNTFGERQAAEAILSAMGVEPARTSDEARERAVAAETRLEELSLKSRRANQMWLVGAMSASVVTIAIGLYQHGVNVAEKQSFEAARAAALSAQAVAAMTATQDGLQKVATVRIAEFGGAVSELSTYVDSLTKQIDRRKDDKNDLSDMVPLLDDAKERADTLAKKATIIDSDSVEAKFASASQALLDFDQFKTNLAAINSNINSAAKRIQEAPSKPNDPLAEPRRLWQAGYALANASDIAGARGKYNEALKRNPGYAPAINSLGVLEFDAGRYEQADDFFRRAIKEDPSYAPAHTNHALALRSLGDMRSARLAAETALQKRPGYAPAIRALTLIDNTSKQTKSSGRLSGQSSGQSSGP